MNHCHHCDADSTKHRRSNFLLKWFGIYKQCSHCNRMSMRKWHNKSLAVIVLSILLIQLLTSILVYPLIDLVVVSHALQVALFTMFHIMLLPLYFIISVTFLVNAE